jgi:uncharacterized protein YndB with AHSA1/START domain
MTVRVAASIELSVDPETAFAAVVDLPSQEKWIIATRLYPIEGAVSVPRVGARMAAFTGVGSIGFLDTMTVTEFDPPHRWITDKDGDLLRGVGIMQVDRLPTGCRVTWANELELPFGVIGRLGWPVGRFVAQLAMQACLRRLAKQLDCGVLPIVTREGVAPA